MSSYAVGLLRDIQFGGDIIDYLRRIDATLEPYGGRFLIHGGRPQVREGNWDTDVVVIEFPDFASCVAWYESDAYQQLIPLRSENSESKVALIPGVEPGHRATDIIAARAQRDAG